MPTEHLVAIDFETFYDKAAGYSLTSMSAFAYVHDPRFDAYLVSVFDDDDIAYVGRPEEFDWSKLDGMTPCAHNAAFDLQVYDRLVELKVIAPAAFAGEWVCTADLAAYLGCRRDLKAAAKHLLGVDVSKAARAAADGKSGDLLAIDDEMQEYALGDAEHCLRLAQKFLDKWPADERRVSELSRQTARRGFALDIGAVEAGIAVLAPQVDEALKGIPWAWNEDGTRSADKPLSHDALEAHCAAEGIPHPASLAKDSEDFQKWLDIYSDRYPFAEAMGRYRSVNTLHSRVCNLKFGYDPATRRFPYEKKYFGAGTGRWSGGGDSGMKFNMENMPRKGMYGVDVRPMFVAAPGCKLIVADYAQVEARYLLWLVGDEEKLGPCRLGASVYQAYAERVGDCKPGEDIKHTNDHLYKFEKARVLGLGYFSGAAKFQKFAAGYGIKLTLDEALVEVQRYRGLNPKIVAHWYQHHDWLLFSARRKDDTHQVELRSGRLLTYTRPRLVPSRGRMEVKAYKLLGGPYVNIHGGVLTENEVQASCRDILKDAWVALDREWKFNPVVLTVHDEIVAEVAEDEAVDRAKDMHRIMVGSSPWAEGLPLDTEVIICDRYTK
ncbi:MAG: hypothetical protein GX636_02555 [Actinomycetales bacterium]|nr:hypothetical protein [Actinomycetales bacterium]